jgi:hypothetical protein
VKGSGSGKGKSAEKANEAFQAEQGYEVMLEESEDLKPAKRPRVKKEME